MPSTLAQRALTLAAVPVTLHTQALACINQAQANARGLLWAKWRVRLFKAGQIADLLDWEDERLLDVTDRPADLADCDIAPMLNITAHGDNVPWDPVTSQPAPGQWLNPDPDSPEYQAAVAANYWCPGQHPRSKASRRAWYRRNAGEYRAWRLGHGISPENGIQTWQGQSQSGRLTVTVQRSGGAWLIKAQRRLIGRIGIKTRIGFEVDNALRTDPNTGATIQLWYPIPGHELRAPVTWSHLPGKVTP